MALKLWGDFKPRGKFSFQGFNRSAAPARRTTTVQTDTLDARTGGAAQAEADRLGKQARQIRMDQAGEFFNTKNWKIGGTKYVETKKGIRKYDWYDYTPAEKRRY